MSNIEIDIIIPVLNDLRVLDTIKSVRFFDDAQCVRMVIMAGASSETFLSKVRPLLRPVDVLNTDADEGIFDALNKGMALCTAPVIGWLGGDDTFSGNIRASDVICEFADQATDILVYSTEYHVENKVTRHLSSRWSQPKFVPLGFHNPHFSTFLSNRVYALHTFPRTAGAPNQFSDITFFVDLLRTYRVVTRNVVCTYMAEGGSASGTAGAVWQSAKRRFKLYRKRFGIISGIVAPAVNLSWKMSSALRYKLHPKVCDPLWLSASAKLDT